MNILEEICDEAAQPGPKTILELGAIFKTKQKWKDLVKIYLTVLNLSECTN